jgi:predicted glycoside hydrolase/deacetylase ChbG (UPF0249 family)
MRRTFRPSQVCLIADDFAMTVGVSQSILALLDAGRLSGTGVMSSCRHWPGFAPDLRGFDGRADIGLHLNLTLGRPLGPVRALAESGDFPGFGVLARRALCGLLDGVALEAEITRQLEAFASHFGRLPDFIDGHQHVHVLPAVRGALLRSASRLYGGARKPWIRDPFDTPGAIIARGVAVPKALVIAGLSTAWSRTLRSHGYPSNDGFSGVSPFDPRRSFADDFSMFLRVPGPRHLVMCHPGHVDDELRRLDPVVETRPQEHAFLAGPGLRAALADAQLALVTFHNFQE